MPEIENRSLTDKFMLRLPDGMRERIKAAAEANNRSMNSEILATLSQRYPADDASVLSQVDDLSKALAHGARVVDGVRPSSITLADLLGQQLALLKLVADKAGIDLDTDPQKD